MGNGGKRERKDGGGGEGKEESLLGPNSRHRCCCVSCEDLQEVYLKGCTSAEYFPCKQTRTRLGGSQKDYSRTELASANNLPTEQQQFYDCTKHRRYFRGNLHTTRLKLTKLHLQFPLFLLANFLCKRWTQAKIVTSLVVSLLLFSALIPSTTALQDYRQKSHSGSTFKPWIIDDIEPDSKPTSEVLNHVKQRQRLPDFVLPVNKLFQFELPGDAFGDVQHYQVCEKLKVLWFSAFFPHIFTYILA